MNAHDELSEAPLLKGLHGEAPFVTPDGFFDRFPQQVQGIVVRQGRSKGSPGAWIRWLRPAGAVVALVAVVLLWRHAGHGTQDTSVTQEIIDPYELDLSDTDHTLDLLLDTDGPTLAEVHLPVSDDELLGYIASEEIALDLLIEEL